MDANNYWIECVSEAMSEWGLDATLDQIKFIARAVQSGHENYGLAFYTPPASDRYNEIEREWQRKYKELEAKHDAYKLNAEEAVKKALKQFPDAQVSIGEHGEVMRHGGRTTQIQ